MKKALLTISTLLASLLAAITAFARVGETRVATGQILVRVPAGMSVSDVRALAQRHGCELLRSLSLSGWHVVARTGRDKTVSDEPLTPELNQTISDISAEPGVHAEPDLMVYPMQAKVTPPNDPRFGAQQWHYEMINMSKAWALQDGDGTRVKVGVVDSGIDALHPDFQINGHSRVVASKDFSGTGSQVDLIGHGTHVAGTIAASTNNGTGVAGIAGWEKNGVGIDLVASRVFDVGGASSSIVIEGIKYCGDQGCKVINLSLGGESIGPPPQAEIDVINYVRNLGAIVVVAAGNSSSDSDGVVKTYPADIPGVLKVTAIGPTRKLSSYSSFGGNVFVAAPGGDGIEGGPDAVWSTVPTAGSQIIGAGAGGYYSINGTSMACPHVAGVVALLVAAGANEAEVRDAIQSTAQIPAGGPNSKLYGPGIVDAYAALKLLNPGLSPVNPTVVDRGVTYLSPVAIRARINGTYKMLTGTTTLKGNQVRQSDVNVDVYRVGDSTPVRTFQGGRDFLIPGLLNGDLKTRSFVIDIPSKADNPALRPTDPGVDLPDLNLPIGSQYKIVYRIGTQIGGTQYITLGRKDIPAGRSMFAMPYVAELATGTPSTLTKEQLLLGTASSFSLARYNPLRLPSQEDYARYRSNGSVADPSARFVMGSATSGPLTYDIADPNRSVAPIGVGYWLDVAGSGTSIDTLRLTAGRADASGIEASNAVAIRIFASGGGWNMVGAPFTFPVEWSSVTVQVDGVNYSLAEAISNGTISPALVGYDAERRDYVYAIAPDGVLKPFNAYWVRALRDATIIVPPSQAVGSRAAGKPVRGEGWAARLIASVAGDQDGQNYFGQIQGASDTEDRLDIVKPPAGSGHAYVRFEQKTGTATRSLAFDLRDSSRNERQEWRAAVSSDRSNSDVTLTWEGLRLVPRRYKVTLRDEATGQLIPMQGRASYRYRSGEAGTTRYFQITLEPQASGGSLLFRSVSTEGGTRAQKGTSVRFTLSQDAEIAGVVRTLSGKSVSTLVGATRAQAGKETTLRWSGRAQDGGSLPAGAYIMDITARAGDGSSVRLTRTVQHLR